MAVIVTSIDANEQIENHFDTFTQLINQNFAADEISVVKVINKIDLVNKENIQRREDISYTSAKTGEGIEELFNTICYNIKPIIKKDIIISITVCRITLWSVRSPVFSPRRTVSSLRIKSLKIGVKYTRK